jgi:hypothetical protein
VGDDARTVRQVVGRRTVPLGVVTRLAARNAVEHRVAVLILHAIHATGGLLSAINARLRYQPPKTNFVQLVGQSTMIRVVCMGSVHGDATADTTLAPSPAVFANAGATAVGAVILDAVVRALLRQSELSV